MIVEQISPVPPTYNIAKNVVISIRIWTERNGYEVSIQANWTNEHRFSIEPNKQDVAELNLGLQQAIEEVSRKYGSNGYYDAILKLAQKGYSAFTWIFEDEKL